MSGNSSSVIMEVACRVSELLLKRVAGGQSADVCNVQLSSVLS